MTVVKAINEGSKLKLGAKEALEAGIVSGVHPTLEKLPAARIYSEEQREELYKSLTKDKGLSLRKEEINCLLSAVEHLGTEKQKELLKTLSKQEGFLYSAGKLHEGEKGTEEATREYQRIKAQREVLEAVLTKSINKPEELESIINSRRENYHQGLTEYSKKVEENIQRHKAAEEKRLNEMGFVRRTAEQMYNAAVPAAMDVAEILCLSAVSLLGLASEAINIATLYQFKDRYGWNTIVHAGIEKVSYIFNNISPLGSLVTRKDGLSTDSTWQMITTPIWAGLLAGKAVSSVAFSAIMAGVDNCRVELGMRSKGLSFSEFLAKQETDEDLKLQKDSFYLLATLGLSFLSVRNLKAANASAAVNTLNASRISKLLKNPWVQVMAPSVGMSGAAALGEELLNIGTEKEFNARNLLSNIIYGTANSQVFMASLQGVGYCYVKCRSGLSASSLGSHINSNTVSKLEAESLNKYFKFSQKYNAFRTYVDLSDGLSDVWDVLTNDISKVGLNSQELNTLTKALRSIGFALKFGSALYDTKDINEALGDSSSAQKNIIDSSSRTQAKVKSDLIYGDSGQAAIRFTDLFSKRKDDEGEAGLFAIANGLPKLPEAPSRIDFSGVNRLDQSDQFASSLVVADSSPDSAAIGGSMQSPFTIFNNLPGSSSEEQYFGEDFKVNPNSDSSKRDAESLSAENLELVKESLISQLKEKRKFQEAIDLLNKQSPSDFDKLMQMKEVLDVMEDAFVYAVKNISLENSTTELRLLWQSKLAREDILNRFGLLTAIESKVQELCCIDAKHIRLAAAIFAIVSKKNVSDNCFSLALREMYIRKKFVEIPMFMGAFKTSSEQNIKVRDEAIKYLIINNQDSSERLSIKEIDFVQASDETNNCFDVVEEIREAYSLEHSFIKDKAKEAIGELLLTLKINPEVKIYKIKEIQEKFKIAASEIIQVMEEASVLALSGVAKSGNNTSRPVLAALIVRSFDISRKDYLTSIKNVASQSLISWKSTDIENAPIQIYEFLKHVHLNSRDRNLILAFTQKEALLFHIKKCNFDVILNLKKVFRISKEVIDRLYESVMIQAVYDEEIDIKRLQSNASLVGDITGLIFSVVLDGVMAGLEKTKEILSIEGWINKICSKLNFETFKAELLSSAYRSYPERFLKQFIETEDLRYYELFQKCLAELKKHSSKLRKENDGSLLSQLEKEIIANLREQAVSTYSILLVLNAQTTACNNNDVNITIAIEFIETTFGISDEEKQSCKKDAIIRVCKKPEYVDENFSEIIKILSEDLIYNDDLAEFVDEMVSHILLLFHGEEFFQKRTLLTNIMTTIGFYFNDQSVQNIFEAKCLREERVYEIKRQLAYGNIESAVKSIMEENVLLEAEMAEALILQILSKITEECEKEEERDRILVDLVEKVCFDEENRSKLNSVFVESLKVKKEFIDVFERLANTKERLTKDRPVPENINKIKCQLLLYILPKNSSILFYIINSTFNSCIKNRNIQFLEELDKENILKFERDIIILLLPEAVVQGNFAGFESFVRNEYFASRIDFGEIFIEAISRIFFGRDEKIKNKINLIEYLFSYYPFQSIETEDIKEKKWELLLEAVSRAVKTLITSSATIRTNDICQIFDAYDFSFEEIESILIEEFSNAIKFAMFGLESFASIRSSIQVCIENLNLDPNLEKYILKRAIEKIIISSAKNSKDEKKLRYDNLKIEEIQKRFNLEPGELKGWVIDGMKKYFSSYRQAEKEVNQYFYLGFRICSDLGLDEIVNINSRSLALELYEAEDRYEERLMSSVDAAVFYLPSRFPKGEEVKNKFKEAAILFFANTCLRKDLKDNLDNILKVFSLIGNKGDSQLPKEIIGQMESCYIQVLFADLHPEYFEFGEEEKEKLSTVLNAFSQSKEYYRFHTSWILTRVFALCFRNALDSYLNLVKPKGKDRQVAVERVEKVIEASNIFGDLILLQRKLNIDIRDTNLAKTILAAIFHQTKTFIEKNKARIILYRQDLRERIADAIKDIIKCFKIEDNNLRQADDTTALAEISPEEAITKIMAQALIMNSENLVLAENDYKGLAKLRSIPETVERMFAAKITKLELLIEKAIVFYIQESNWDQVAVLIQAYEVDSEGIIYYAQKSIVDFIIYYEKTDGIRDRIEDIREVVDLSSNDIMMSLLKGIELRLKILEGGTLNLSGELALTNKLQEGLDEEFEIIKKILSLATSFGIPYPQDKLIKYLEELKGINSIIIESVISKLLGK